MAARTLDGLVDRFVMSEERFAGSEVELANARADNSVLREALAIAQKAKESWPQDVEQIARLRADAINERANANNLGVSLTRLQLQANGWKEENEQLRKDLIDAEARIRETDARLFLELIHLGRTVNDARAILAAANDIRKNGLTPQT